jgi:hypothetical protein
MAASTGGPSSYALLHAISQRWQHELDDVLGSNSSTPLVQVSVVDFTKRHTTLLLEVTFHQVTELNACSRTLEAIAAFVADQPETLWIEPMMSAAPHA